MNALHLVAHCRPFLSPLLDRDACADLWQRLRSRFREVAACILMPDHLHLLALHMNARQAAWDLSVELRAWTKKFHPGKRIWTPVPTPEPIRDMLHLKRQIRYVHLNPCRSGLAKDPIEWEWSTHRDVVGYAIDPWPKVELLERVFGVSKKRLPEVMHRYISADPTVSVTGSRLQMPGGRIVADPSTLIWASSVVRREGVRLHRGPQRELAVRLAHELRIVPEPASFNVSQSTWARMVRGKIGGEDVQAALKVLGDPRCRRFQTQRG